MRTYHRPTTEPASQHDHQQPTPRQPQSATTGLPMHTTPAHVVKMQQRLGNAAVRRFLQRKAGPNRVQRTYLDQEGAYEAVAKAIRLLYGEGKLSSKESIAVNDILGALETYQQKDKADVIDLNASRDALRELKSAITTNSANLVAAKEIMDGVLEEVNTVMDDFEWLDTNRTLIKNEDWNPNANELAEKRKEIVTRFAKYHPKNTRLPYYKSIRYHFYEAQGDIARRISNYKIQNNVSNLGFEFGDEKGELKGKNQLLMNDFLGIQEFLKHKNLVLVHLQPLAKRIQQLTEKGVDPIAAIKQGLGEREKEAGFSDKPLIPLGILPGDVFVDLISSGNVLDDYGAGLQHGELSHRIQWYAIITAYNSGSLGTKHTPIELYKAMNTAPFNESRTGNSVWGMVLDKGTSASDTTYSAPGTLNRDLLESIGSPDPKEPGLAERKSSYKVSHGTDYSSEIPQVGGLEPIGYALAALRKLRIEQAKQHSGDELDKQWQEYGTPPPKTAAAVEKQMEGSSAFELHSQSKTTDPKPWKVLKPTDD